LRDPESSALLALLSSFEQKSSLGLLAGRWTASVLRQIRVKPALMIKLFMFEMDKTGAVVSE
jgi:hypothetical protein